MALELLTVSTSSQPTSATFSPPAEDTPSPPCRGVVDVNELIPETAHVLRCYDVVGDGKLGNHSGTGGMATRSWASISSEDDCTDEDELAPMMPPAANSSSLAAQQAQPCEGCEALVRSVQVGGRPVEAAPAALPMPSAPAPAAPTASWFGAFDAADVEEAKEELAPQTSRSTADSAAIAWAEMRSQWIGDKKNAPKEAAQEPIIRFLFLLVSFICLNKILSRGYVMIFASAVLEPIPVETAVR
ncbi:hypothetical protein ACQ4PT_053029 [Festuca glaucescens]